LSEPPSSLPTARQAQLLALADELRPELHRYCARLMGSVIDGEDVVQDTFTRAYVAVDELQDDPPLRAWLFRIAHNRALDLQRSHARFARLNLSRWRTRLPTRRVQILWR